MEIKTIRFGTIVVDDTDVITMPQGVIGFPNARRFVLVPHGQSTLLAWLQAVEVAELAFPVVSAHVLVKNYPDVPIQAIAERAKLGSNIEDLAVLAVLSAQQSEPATVNLLAPIMINAESRVGAQVFLEGSRFSTRELFVLPRAAETASAKEAPVSDETQSP